MAKLLEFASMPVPPRHVRLTPRETKVSRGTEEENSWTKRQRHWRNIKAQLAAKAAEKQAQQREKPLTLIGGGEKPHLPPLPKSLQHAQIPAKDVEQIQSTYHWRPCQLSEHVYAADLPGRSLGTYVNTLSYDLGKETLQDLSAIRFCKTGGLSLTDEVTLHTVDVGSSRLVCLQGHLHECFFGSDSKRPVAILPESCRPKELMHFVTSGSGPGGFHLVQLRPQKGSGIGGDLMWKDGVWSHDQVHLTGIMYEVNADALEFSFLDASWTPEILRIFVAEFQRFLISKFGSIDEAWDEAFDLDGLGAANFTQFSMGCKKAGYVGNATRLWAAINQDGGAEVSLEELARDYLNPPAEPEPESEMTRRPSLAQALSGLDGLPIPD